MKRVYTLFGAIIMIILLPACGEDKSSVNEEIAVPVIENSEEPEEEQVEESVGMPVETATYDATDLESMVDYVETISVATEEFITTKTEELSEKLGDSYKTYDEHKELVPEFYSSTIFQAENLYAAMEAVSLDYYKCIAEQGLEDYSTWNDAMGDYYDAWNDAMSDFYDVWDDSYKDIYTICDELVKAGYDDLEYTEYSDAWSEMYGTYSDSWSAMYNAYSDAWSLNYNVYSDVWSGLYNGETDVDAILEAAAKEDRQEAESIEEAASDVTASDDDEVSNDTELADDEAESSSDTTTDGMRPEFKEAMDAYEAFYDEYCDFMKKYSKNPTDLELLANYTDMISQADEMNEAFAAWDNSELSSEELKYYMDVNNRVMQKLIDVAG